jgi:hypothetical protein
METIERGEWTFYVAPFEGVTATKHAWWGEVHLSEVLAAEVYGDTRAEVLQKCVDHAMARLYSLKSSLTNGPDLLEC